MKPLTYGTEHDNVFLGHCCGTACETMTDEFEAKEKLWLAGEHRRYQKKNNNSA
jgi:hypothetical protein